MSGLTTGWCSGDVPGCSRVFRNITGYSGGVPGCFGGFPGCAGGVLGRSGAFQVVPRSTELPRKGCVIECTTFDVYRNFCLDPTCSLRLELGTGFEIRVGRSH